MIAEVEVGFKLIEMPAEEYYADPCEAPSLTQSTAHTLLTKSPLHAWMGHPKLGGFSREATEDMDRGTILHDLLLCDGPTGRVELLFHDDYRTKDARADRDRAKAAGRMPVLAADMDNYVATANGIREQIERMGISLVGQPEGVVTWIETADDGTDVLCRLRMDLWQPESLEGPTILDLKTTTCAHPNDCVKSMLKYGGDIQRAAYTSAIEHTFPELAGRVRFMNLFAEISRPYLVTPILHSGTMKSLGQMKWRRAINLWAECLKRGKEQEHWPGYVTKPIEVSPPQWAMQSEFSEAFN